MGHEAGDQLLQEIAGRLKQTLRVVDVVARLRGREFVILIEELSDLNQVETVAGKILSAIIKPMNIMNEECRVTASIGISVYPKDAETTIPHEKCRYGHVSCQGGRQEQLPILLRRYSIKIVRTSIDRNKLALPWRKMNYPCTIRPKWI